MHIFSRLKSKTIVQIGLIFSLCSGSALAQKPANELIQLTGVVVSGDSLVPVPFASVTIKGTDRGTVADYFGFFALVAKRTDTILFRCVGYKPAEVMIADTLSDVRYSMIQMLQRDTVMLSEQVVYPWPTREQFRQAFLTLQAPDDDYDRAFANLVREDIRYAAQGLPPNAAASAQADIQREYSKLYQMGQVPQISLLNPLAWMQFVQAWRNGDFKRKQ